MIIYLLTNKINNKKYVGVSTSKNKKKRIKDHFAKARRNDCNQLITKKIKEYGIENWDHQIIFETNCIDKLYEKEIYYIKKYKTLVTENGYNIALGGKSPMLGRSHSENSKKQMSINKKNNSKFLEQLTKRAKETQSIKFQIILPDDSIIISDGLKDFCRKHKLNPSNLSFVAKHYSYKKYKNRQHLGYICLYPEFKITSDFFIKSRDIVFDYYIHNNKYYKTNCSRKLLKNLGYSQNKAASIMAGNLKDKILTKKIRYLDTINKNLICEIYKNNNGTTKDYNCKPILTFTQLKNKDYLKCI